MKFRGSEDPVDDSVTDGHEKDESKGEDERCLGWLDGQQRQQKHQLYHSEEMHPQHFHLPTVSEMRLGGSNLLNHTHSFEIIFEISPLQAIPLTDWQSVCVCVCACVRAHVCACVCMHVCACLLTEACFDCALFFVMGYVLLFGETAHTRVQYYYYHY